MNEVFSELIINIATIVEPKHRQLSAKVFRQCQIEQRTAYQIIKSEFCQHVIFAHMLGSTRRCLQYF